MSRFHEVLSATMESLSGLESLSLTWLPSASPNRPLARVLASCRQLWLYFCDKFICSKSKHNKFIRGEFVRDKFICGKFCHGRSLHLCFQRHFICGLFVCGLELVVFGSFFLSTWCLVVVWSPPLFGIAYVCKLVGQRWREILIWRIPFPIASCQANSGLTFSKSFSLQLSLQLQNALEIAYNQVPGCNSKWTNIAECLAQYFKTEFKATGYIWVASWDEFAQRSQVCLVEKADCNIACIRRVISKVWKPV